MTDHGILCPQLTLRIMSYQCGHGCTWQRRFLRGSTSFLQHLYCVLLRETYERETYERQSLQMQHRWCSSAAVSKPVARRVFLVLPHSCRRVNLALPPSCRRVNLALPHSCHRVPLALSQSCRCVPLALPHSCRRVTLAPPHSCRRLTLALPPSWRRLLAAVQHTKKSDYFVTGKWKRSRSSDHTFISLSPRFSTAPAASPHTTILESRQEARRSTTSHGWRLIGGHCNFTVSRAVRHDSLFSRRKHTFGKLRHIVRLLGSRRNRHLAPILYDQREAY